MNVLKPDMVQSGAGLSMACCTVTELHSRAEDPDSVIRRTTPLLLESTYAISHYSKEGAKVTKIKEQDMNWARQKGSNKEKKFREIQSYIYEVQLKSLLTLRPK